MTIAGETEVLGENLPSATLSHHKSHMPRSGFEPRTEQIELFYVIVEDPDLESCEECRESKPLKARQQQYESATTT
jgi:hypothetical protein